MKKLILAPVLIASSLALASPDKCPRVRGDFVFGKEKKYLQLNWDKLTGLRFKNDGSVVGLDAEGLESMNLFSAKLRCFKDGGRWNASFDMTEGMLPAEIFVGVDGQRLYIRMDGDEDLANFLTVK